MIFSRMIAGIDQSIRRKHQEAAVEPGRKQVHEIASTAARSSRWSIASIEPLAHGDQRLGAAGRKVEAAKQLLPARLGGAVKLGAAVSEGALPTPRPPLERSRSGPNRCAKASKKGDARPVVSSANRNRMSRASAVPDASPRTDTAPRTCRRGFPSVPPLLAARGCARPAPAALEIVWSSLAKKDVFIAITFPIGGRPGSV